MIEHEQTQQTVAQLAAEIAAQLHETEPGPRIAISKVINFLGRATCLDLLHKTQEIEAKGGMMTSNGDRRRTPGGVWFYLARGVMTPEQRRAVWPRLPKVKKKPAQGAPDARPQPAKPKAPKEKQSAPTPAWTWDDHDRIAAVQEAETEKGTASVKITLVGRPGKIVDRGQCIVTVMEDGKTPALPKGLPTPTPAPTKYAVYIASKQWKKVEEAIKDPEDALIVEGIPKTDAQVSAIAVFTTNVTTKKLQAAQRQTQKGT